MFVLFALLTPTTHRVVGTRYKPPAALPAAAMAVESLGAAVRAAAASVAVDSQLRLAPFVHVAGSLLRAGLFLYCCSCQSKHMSTQFSYKLTDTDIWVHLLYRIHPTQAQKLDGAGVLETIKKAITHHNQFLEHAECNILIFSDTFGVIPEQGIGGRCGQSDLINIFIDPEHEAGVKHNITKWLPAALAHELYHARRYVTHQFATVLGESLIEEGLPSMFEEFIQPDLEVPYAHHLNKKELAQAWEQAQPLLNSENYNRDDWFYGSKKMKKWTGYSLGYDIVRQYMGKHGEKDPTKFIDTPASDFLKGYDPSKPPHPA